jgi:hypothetical protein
MEVVCDSVAFSTGVHLWTHTLPADIRDGPADGSRAIASGPAFALADLALVLGVISQGLDPFEGIGHFDLVGFVEVANHLLARQQFNQMLLPTQQFAALGLGNRIPTPLLRFDIDTNLLLLYNDFIDALRKNEGRYYRLG